MGVLVFPGSGRSPGEGNSNPLQYSCLENPTDRGAWWATVHGVVPRRLPAVSLGAGLCPCRGAQMSTPTRFPMPASSEGPCFYWGCPGFACIRGLCSLTGGQVMLLGHRPDTVSVSLCQAGPGPSNRFSLCAGPGRMQGPVTRGIWYDSNM